MAILLANKDGTSNAKAGDIVVTGGGIYRKNSDGTSSKMSGLPTSSGTSKDYSVVSQVYRDMLNSNSGNGGTSNPVYRDSYVQDDYRVNSMDNNGIAKVEVDGYDPSAYTVSGSASSSSMGSMSNILGYVILGLLGIAILDKFIGK